MADGERTVERHRVRVQGREFVPVAYEMARVRSDAAGRLQATFKTPEDFGFVHDIVLQQGDRLMTQVAYSIDMSVEISPKERTSRHTNHDRGEGHRLSQSRDVLESAVQQQVDGLDLRGDDARIGTVDDSGDRSRRRSRDRSAARPVRVPLSQPGAESRTRPATIHRFPSPSRRVLRCCRPRRPRRRRRTYVCAPAHGELQSSPRFSGVGERVTVTGEAFTAGERYTLNWTRVIGNRIDGGGWETSSMPVGEAVADRDGRVSSRFATPDDLGGTHGLFIDAGGTRRIGTHFVKSTALPMDVTRGPVGTKITLHLKGVGWTETSNIMHLVYDNAYIGYACAFNSQGDVTIYMEATGEPGWHFIDLYPGIYKGSETLPINYRMPQLTYAADHPGEDLPAFRFAFEVTSAGGGCRAGAAARQRPRGPHHRQSGRDGGVLNTGKVVAGTVAPFALAGLGLSVRAGAPKPDMSTVEAYTATLLAAKSIGYSRGCSGQHVAEGIAQLGLTEQLKAKTKFTAGGPVTDSLARGDFEIGIQQTNIMVGVPGTDYVGPLPGYLNKPCPSSVALLTVSKQPEAARAMIAFMISPEAAHFLRKTHVEPAAH